MKALKITTYVATVGLVVLGIVLAKTNPSPEEYEAYAAQRLTKYFKDDICQKKSKLLEKLFHLNCIQLIDSTSPEIRKIITENTKRRNYIFFSVYQSEIKIHYLVPGYTFDTLGILAKFYPFKAEKE
jgi:hypothetical protein